MLALATVFAHAAAGAPRAKLKLKTEAAPESSPSPGASPNFSEYLFCNRMLRDSNRNLVPSAEATVRLELTKRPDLKKVFDEVPATAQLYHLKMFSARGTDLGQRKMVRANGKFDLERDAQWERKFHTFTSDKLDDGEIKEMHVSAANTVDNPSFVRVGSSRYHFMLCRHRDGA